MSVSIYSDIATIQNAPAPATLNASAVDRGKVRVNVGSYTAEAVAADTELALFKLHLGDVVLLAGSWIGTEDTFGAARTIAIGDDDSVTAVDADRYLAATDVSSAGIFQFNDVTTALTKVPYTIQEDCWCIATLAGDTFTGDIRFEIFVSNNN